LGVRDNPCQRVGLGKGEDLPGTGPRVESVREMRLRPAGLEYERQPAVTGQRLQPDLGGQALGVAGRLPFHARQRHTFRLGLDHPGRALLDVQQVVDPAMAWRQHHLTHRHAGTGEQVHVFAVLHSPAGGAQLAVDQHPGALLRLQTEVVVRWRHGRKASRPRPRQPAIRLIQESAEKGESAGEGGQRLE
jgi:hypothetical protein